MSVHGRNGLTPTQAKIVFHLAPLSSLADSYLQPGLVTQDGIASSVGIARNHIPQAINDLIAGGMVTAKKARVDGAPRKKTCYFLTQDGLRSVKEPAEPVKSRETPRKDGEHFVARRRELKELGSWLASGVPVMVLEGERGIGKTALLKRLKAKDRHIFHWSLARDGALKDGLLSLATGLPDGHGRMLAYVLRSEQGVNHGRVVSLLDELDDAVVLVIDDADALGGKADVEALASAFAKSNKAKLLLSGELVAAPGNGRKLRLEALSRTETVRLAKLIGYDDVADVYESSGGRPLLVKMWSPAGKGKPLRPVAPAEVSRKEARAFRKLLVFERPVHIGEAAALGIDYQMVSWLARKNLVMVANHRIHPIASEAVPARAGGRAVAKLRSSAAGAILATWNDPAHDLEACRHYLGAGEEGECGKVVAERGERMLKAGLARQLDDVFAGLDIDRLDERTRARVLTVLGTLRKMGGVWEEALACFEKARGLVDGDDAFWAESTARIASVQLARRDLPKAMEAYREALSRLPSGQPRIEARIRDEIATVNLRNGDIEGAAESSDMAVKMASGNGNAELLGLCEATRGNIFLAGGELGDAERCFSGALAKVRGGSNVRAEGTILMNLATVKHRRGDFEEARALWRECVALLERHGDPRYCMALSNLAAALWRSGDWNGSRECRAAALPVARLTKDRAVEGALATVEGNEALHSGKLDDALAAYRKGLEIKAALPDRMAKVRAKCDVANALVCAGRPSEALDELKDDAGWARSSGRSEEAATVLLASARALLASRDSPGARELLKAAFAACPAGDSGGKAQVLRMLGVCAAADGEWYVAKRYLEDAVAMYAKSGDDVEGMIARYDLAEAFKRLGLEGADEAMKVALDSAARMGMAFPPANSDWPLVSAPAESRPG